MLAQPGIQKNICPAREQLIGAIFLETSVSTVKSLILCPKCVT